MAVRVSSSGPRGAKTYEIRWKDGELYDYTDNSYDAKRIAAKARKEEREMRARYTRKNPTKAQKREKARKASVQRRVATALANFLKKANPAMKTTGARITKLKGGGFNIRPIKASNPGKTLKRWDVSVDGGRGFGVAATSKKQATAIARRMLGQGALAEKYSGRGRRKITIKSAGRA